MTNLGASPILNVRESVTDIVNRAKSDQLFIPRYQNHFAKLTVYLRRYHRYVPIASNGDRAFLDRMIVQILHLNSILTDIIAETGTPYLSGKYQVFKALDTLVMAIEPYLDGAIDDYAPIAKLVACSDRVDGLIVSYSRLRAKRDSWYQRWVNYGTAMVMSCLPGWSKA